MEDISPEENLITKERLAKGDLLVALNIKGNINRAIPANLTVIKELIRRSVFPYHYEIYGVGFMELRNAFRSPWAVRSAAVLLEQWGVGVSNAQADQIYEVVARKIGRECECIVEFLVDAPKEKENKKSHAEYKACLEKLVAAMDEERNRILAEKM